jgi:RimJ/RimL family protein N-acetyltransferase
MISRRVTLRDVIESDISIFFEQQLDSEANWMAAFTSANPHDREAFLNHWRMIRSNDNAGGIKTIELDESIVAGYVLSYHDVDLGQLEVAYWIGRDYWGRGVATKALYEFLNNFQKSRPIFARVAKDNLGSLRVLQKCNFKVVGEGKGFANARGKETEEFVLKLAE